MAPPPLLPSVTEFTIAYLTPLVAPVRVSADLVGYTAGDAWVQVSRSGGPPRGTSSIIATPRLDANCYESSKPAAEALAETVLNALLSIDPAVTYPPGLVISDVTVFQDITDLTDPENSQPRYVLSVELTARAAA